MMSRGVMTIRPMVIDRGGGACEESQVPFFVFFPERTKGILFIFSLAPRKRTKRGALPPRPPSKGDAKNFSQRPTKNFRFW